jgi:hypothetical protein
VIPEKALKEAGYSTKLVFQIDSSIGVTILCGSTIRDYKARSMRNFSNLPSCLSIVLQKNSCLSGPILIEWLDDKLCHKLSTYCKAMNVDLNDAVMYNNALGQPL